MRNDLYLIDSSVWIEALARGRGSPELRHRVDELLEKDQAATTGMILLEVLAGARDEQDLRSLEEMLLGLHQVPVAEERWLEAASLGFQLRRRGVTVPFTDLLIAAVAIVAGAALLHRDRHFDAIAAHAPLIVESLVSP